MHPKKNFYSATVSAYENRATLFFSVNYMKNILYIALTIKHRCDTI